MIYAGTDDGNLQMTRDGGQTWINLSDKLSMPSDRFFTRLVCSVHNVGTVYAACARYYEANDLKPYLFRSSDAGRTWTRAPGLIPVAIDDIKIQMPTGDVVLGSYGRGLIIGR